MLTLDLTDRAALVIGGSRGIGAATCRQLAVAGAKVAWTHTGSDAGTTASQLLAEEIAAAGGECFHLVADCTDADAARRVVTEVLARWGRLDCLVYNAGFTSPVSLLDLTPEEWRRVVDLNLNGAFLAVHAALPAMLERGGGSVVLVGSAAVAGGGGGRADYVSAKAGLEGLSRAITKEFAPRGVRCNVVHPSLVETELLTQRYPDPADRATVAAQVPLRRLGQPEDIAHAVAFLLSDLASYITGQSLYVDGGRTFCR
jgi:3-oxoacyl-[acyl-carrier protein] reductase